MDGVTLGLLVYCGPNTLVFLSLLVDKLVPELCFHSSQVKLRRNSALSDNRCRSPQDAARQSQLAPGGRPFSRLDGRGLAVAPLAGVRILVDLLSIIAGFGTTRSLKKPVPSLMFP